MASTQVIWTQNFMDTRSYESTSKGRGKPSCKLEQKLMHGLWREYKHFRTQQIAPLIVCWPVTLACVTGWLGLHWSVSHDHSNKTVISSKAVLHMVSSAWDATGVWCLSTASNASTGVVTLLLLKVTRFPCVLTVLYNMKVGEGCFPLFCATIFIYAHRFYCSYSHIWQSTS